MKYQIEEFWLDEFPTGEVIQDLVEDNYLKYYELYSLETKHRPPPSHGMGLYGADRQWHIVRFRKKVEE